MILSTYVCVSEASALDPTEPVTLTIDLGGVQKLESLAISWEFPAKSFAVSVSSDGVKWVEVFATDSNVLASTQVSLGAVTASKVRVVMHEVSRFAVEIRTIRIELAKRWRLMRSMESFRVAFDSMRIMQQISR